MNFKYIVFLLIVLVTISCKKEDVVTPSPTNLVVQVKQNATLLNNVTVYVFDKESDYLLALDGDLSKAILTAKTVEGLAKFENVKNDVIYYFYVSYVDPQSGLAYNNSSKGYKLSQFLNANSETTIAITLQPVTRAVAFWSNTYANAQIYFDNVSNTLSGIRTTAPSIGDETNAFVKNVDSDKHFYSVRVGNCIYEDTIHIATAEYKTIEIPACQIGMMGFYAMNLPSSKFPLKIMIDNSSVVVGQISANATAVPNAIDANSSSFVKVYRNFGLHSYKVVANDGTCVWTSSLTLNSTNSNLFVKLDNCN